MVSDASSPEDSAHQPTHRWEIPVADWGSLRATIRDRLERSARLRHSIAYSNLVSGLPFEGANSHALADMLGEISKQCHDRGEPMLSAIAVYISGEKQGEPGPGFYAAATHLGLLPKGASELEALMFWGNEVERCFEHYGKTKRRKA